MTMDEARTVMRYARQLGGKLRDVEWSITELETRYDTMHGGFGGGGGRTGPGDCVADAAVACADGGVGEELEKLRVWRGVLRGDRDLVNDALNRIHGECAAVLRQRYFGGRSMTNIAVLLEMTPSTAKRREREGLEKVAALLGDHPEAEGRLERAREAAL